MLVDAAVQTFSTAGWKDVAEPKAYLYRSVLNQARQANRSRHRRVRRKATWSAGTQMHEPSHASIARLLGVSPRTVQRELGRARTHLELLLR